MSMRLIETEEILTFQAADGRLAGRYDFADAFKPSLHPLTTPGGLVVSAFMPHDHKHHRAMMYALRTPDINFWEERETLPGEVVGRQAHRGFSELAREGDHVGFTQALLWSAKDGSLPTFSETRRIDCSISGDGTAFLWEWSTELVALRATVLMMSQWSVPKPDGTLVNYHGLGLRLPREFGGAQADIAVHVDGQLVDIETAQGAVPKQVSYSAAVDGYWPIRRAGIRIVQSQRNPLFMLKDPFAYLSLGSSNLAERRVSEGERIAEHYRFQVFDGEAPSD